MGEAAAFQTDFDAEIFAALDLERTVTGSIRDSAAELLAAPDLSERSAAGAFLEPEHADAAESSADEGMVCSICLHKAELAEIASVKGCDHTYCLKCIVRWATHRETPTCPQCKGPLNYVATYYRIDGTLHDFPTEEPITLLKRARWFTDYMQTAEDGRWRLSADDGSSEWRDYEPFYQEYDDDEEVEAYYFSAAAGRARVTLGNRRWGENGYVASGRMSARPVAASRGNQKKKKGNAAPAAAAAASDPQPAATLGRRKQKKQGAAAAAATPCAATPSSQAAELATPVNSRRGSSSSNSQPIPAAARARASQSPEAGEPLGSSPYGTSPAGSSPGSGGSQRPEGTGRRARRNNRRAHEDALASL